MSSIFSQDFINKKHFVSVIETRISINFTHQIDAQKKLIWKSIWYIILNKHQVYEISFYLLMLKMTKKDILSILMIKTVLEKFQMIIEINSWINQTVIFWKQCHEKWEKMHVFYIVFKKSDSFNYNSMQIRIKAREQLHAVNQMKKIHAHSLKKINNNDFDISWWEKFIIKHHTKYFIHIIRNAFHHITISHIVEYNLLQCVFKLELFTLLKIKVKI